MYWRVNGRDVAITELDGSHLANIVSWLEHRSAYDDRLTFLIDEAERRERAGHPLAMILIRERRLHEERERKRLIEEAALLKAAQEIAAQKHTPEPRKRRIRLPGIKTSSPKTSAPHNPTRKRFAAIFEDLDNDDDDAKKEDKT